MSGAVFGPLALAGFLASAMAALVMAAWLIARPARLGATSGACAAAFLLMAAWALVRPVLGPDAAAGRLLLGASYLAWLWALYRMFAQDGRHASLSPIRPVVVALGFVGLMQMTLALAAAGTRIGPATDQILMLGTVFRLLFCVGALVLVHNLYAGASGAARAALRWPAAALALMWFYDLNMQTVAYLSGRDDTALAALRGLVPLAMAACFALGWMSSGLQQGLRPSRTFAFRSLSLVVIGSYFALMVIVFEGVAAAGGRSAGLAPLGLLIVAGALALALLPSARLRGWLRVTLVKHLFQHRFDYREEWLRFTRTMGGAGATSLPLRERVVRAVADVTESPAGLLLVPDDHGRLVLAARWQWPDADVPARALDLAHAQHLARTERIAIIGRWRKDPNGDDHGGPIPDWLEQNERAWVLVPLLHYQRLLGVVVLARPAFDRTLDWEDFDLLRVIGRQLASYLAEQESQDALGEVQRFDEFNRRIAFVMHDIKNLASQLALLARNAQKHADKPDFRADMLVTLRNSSDKLNALLARLDRYGPLADEPAAPIDVRRMLKAIAARYAAQHPVVALDGAPLVIETRAEALEQALVHLVQNSVEASEGGAAVVLDARDDGLSAQIEVVDSGSGMSADFVRSHLFQPFHSSKPGGFGIGAFEARETVRAMGGTLDVESREGLGSRFIVRLPRAIPRREPDAPRELQIKVA